MAIVLSGQYDVALISTGIVELTAENFVARSVPGSDSSALTPWEEWADIILCQGLGLAAFPQLARTSKILIIDLYAPMQLEQLAQGISLPIPDWSARVDYANLVMNRQLASGDFFLTASDRQRDFYLGQLASLGRLEPENFISSPNFRRLIDVVPFGIETVPSRSAEVSFRSQFPGIAPDDKVIIWGGGVYDWFDPLTLIESTVALSVKEPTVRLLFMGMTHPNSHLTEMSMVSRVRALAEELDPEGRLVFFNESWVDYTQRGDYFLDSDVGVSTHFDNVETRFSFRTRLLDYIWAGLPIVTTGGDVLADEVQRLKLGVVVAEGDTAGLTAALEKVLYDEAFNDQCRLNVIRLREDLDWHTVLQPLLVFLEDARLAPDSPRSRGGLSRNIRIGPSSSLWVRINRVIKHEGFRGAARRVTRRFGLAKSSAEEQKS